MIKEGRYKIRKVEDSVYLDIRSLRNYILVSKTTIRHQSLVGRVFFFISDLIFRRNTRAGQFVLQAFPLITESYFTASTASAGKAMTLEGVVARVELSRASLTCWSLDERVLGNYMLREPQNSLI